METKYTLLNEQKEIYEVEINFDQLTISRDEVELTLGYTTGSADEHFSNLIDQIILQIPDRCEIRAGFRLIDMEKTEDGPTGLNIGGIFFNTDKIVTGQLKKSERAAVFLVTIGKGMELWSKELLNDGDIVRGYLVDAVASITAENVTDILHDHIGKRMEESGLNITNRYSPGYCLWQVSEQHKLFSLLPVKFLGVTLTESALMQPIKSVSGIIGIGADVKYKVYICDKCGVKDCTYRAVRARN